MILEQQNSKQWEKFLKAVHMKNRNSSLNKINFETNANVVKFILIQYFNTFNNI